MLKTESHLVRLQEQLWISWYVVFIVAPFAHFRVTSCFFTFVGWQHLQFGRRRSLPSVAFMEDPQTPAHPVTLYFLRDTQMPLFAVSCLRVCSPKFLVSQMSAISAVGTHSGQHLSFLAFALNPFGQVGHTGVSTVICGAFPCGRHGLPTSLQVNFLHPSFQVCPTPKYFPSW